jgi:hypothetical protein
MSDRKYSQRGYQDSDREKREPRHDNRDAPRKPIEKFDPRIPWDPKAPNMMGFKETFRCVRCGHEESPDIGSLSKCSKCGTALRAIGRSLGLGTDDIEKARTRASGAMATRLDDAIRASTDRLIGLYELDGRASGDVLARLTAGVALDAPISEGKAAMMGGVVSGALSGLAADLAAGGLTFGAGMLTGAVLGALGGAGIARSMNLARGKSGMTLRWEDAFLAGLVASALLRYLAIAHYGRGRGDWSETEYPPFWPPLVAAIVDERRDRLVRLWAQREPACDVERMASGLRDLLADAAREALDRLYPGALGDQRDGASTQTR